MSTVISKDGTRIGMSVVGSGPALVLVDGALCWRASGPSGPLAEQLKDRFTVYSYDRRGRGESGDTAPFAPQREIEDLDAVIAAAGGTAMVYAISSGVGLALAAAEAGSAITKMVLYEMPIMVDASRAPIAPDYGAKLTTLLAAGDNAGAVRHFMRNGVGVPAFVVWMMQVLGATKKLAPVGPTLPYDMALVMPLWTNRPIPAGRWDRVTMPVLCVGGSKSDAWMRNAQVAIAAALPNGTHQTLGGQNHMVAARAIAPVVRRFLGG